MMGLVLSIAVLLTGTIVQTVEAKGKPNPDEPKTSIKLSCNDRKDVLNCKSSSRQLLQFTVDFPGIDDRDIDYDGPCLKNQPFSDPTIDPDTTYYVALIECGTGLTYNYEIIIDLNSKLDSILLINYTSS